MSQIVIELFETILISHNINSMFNRLSVVLYNASWVYDLWSVICGLAYLEWLCN